MVSGAPTPGGYKQDAPGGQRHQKGGGISFAGNGWRAFSGHKDVDFTGEIYATGPQVAQSRTAVNVRRDAKTTGVTYTWTLPTRPGGSSAVVTGSGTPTGGFTPDATGEYVLRAVVTFTGSDSPNTIQQDFTYVSD